MPRPEASDAKGSREESVRFTRRWLAELEEEEVIEGHDYGAPPFCYRDLNSLLRRTALEKGGLERPDYAWGALQGLNLAKVLGVPRVSFIEFGVAGGNGLVALENIARHLQTIFDIEIDIYGFDAVGGLPKSRDHRDLPNLWREGLLLDGHGKTRGTAKKGQAHVRAGRRDRANISPVTPCPRGVYRIRSVFL